MNVRASIQIKSLKKSVSYAHKIQTNAHKYYYFLGKGNNEDIVKRVMNTRPQWNEAPTLNGSELIQFRWQQNYYGYNYDKMGDGVTKKEIYNHFEHHKEITTKTGLIKNLQRHCSNIKIDPFSLTPTVFTINLEDRNYQQELNQFYEFYQFNMPECFKKNSNEDKSHIALDLPTININYVSPYRFNFDATQSYNISRTRYFCQVYQSSDITPAKLSDTFLSNINYLWLLKPADMNRGNGVHVFNNLEELEILLQSYYSGWFQKEFESPS